MDIISKAMHFAVDAHKGERRKGDGEPLVLHARETASVVATLTEDETVIAAAVLHDTVEDSNITLDTIRAEFGDRVAELVAAETENKRRDVPADVSWKIRKEEAREVLKNTKDTAVKMIFLGDKLSNMRSFYNLKQRLGDKMWERFNQKNSKEHHWYYRTIADNLKDFADTLAFKEYDGLVSLVFNEAKGEKR